MFTLFHVARGFGNHGATERLHPFIRPRGSARSPRVRSLRSKRLTASEIKTAAFGLFPSETRLEEVVTSLNSAGFESEHICVFLSPEHPIADGVRSMKATAANFSSEPDLAQTIVWLSTFGGVLIPGVGFFVGSAEYLRALARPDSHPQASINGAVLTSLGIPKAAAARYEERLRRDASLVFVSCDDSARSEWAREILRRMRAEEVCLLEEFDRVERKHSRGESHLVI